MPGSLARTYYVTSSSHAVGSHHRPARDTHSQRFSRLAPSTASMKSEQERESRREEERESHERYLDLKISVRDICVILLIELLWCYD